jgi:magnesium transporter
MLPMLLKLVHIDPAVATSPFVTTAVDLLGLLAFFTLAGRYLVVG